jgi:HAMP domain-containing protein
VTKSRWYQPRRLAASVRLPWVLGVTAMLGLVVVTGLLGGRVDTGIIVPTAVLDAQQASTDSAAQQVRRGLNAGLQDLSQLAAGLGFAEKPGDLEPYLKDFAGRYHRYRTVYLVDGVRHVLARTGGDPHPDTVPDKPAQPGMTNALKIDSVPVVVQYAPVRLRDKRTGTLVAEYDVAYVRNALDTVRPTTVWVVDNQGEVVASTAGFSAFQQLDRDDLRRAATTAHDHSGVATAGGSQSAKDIVAYAPVHGDGPASALAWGVVTSRSVNTVALPQTQARRQALLFSLVLAALTVLVFGWLLVLFLRPLRELVRQAERLADGDLAEPVEIRRYDEIGLVGRALERMRVRAIREATQRRPAPPRGEPQARVGPRPLPPQTPPPTPPVMPPQGGRQPAPPGPLPARLAGRPAPVRQPARQPTRQPTRQPGWGR